MEKKIKKIKSTLSNRGILQRLDYDIINFYCICIFQIL